jgi:predicted RNA-binding Zn-ribbon protein involved in translation (DUF1610 family)
MAQTPSTPFDIRVSRGPRVLAVLLLALMALWPIVLGSFWPRTVPYSKLVGAGALGLQVPEDDRNVAPIVLGTPLMQSDPWAFPFHVEGRFVALRSGPGSIMLVVVTDCRSTLDTPEVRLARLDFLVSAMQPAPPDWCALIPWTDACTVHVGGALREVGIPVANMPPLAGVRACTYYSVPLLWLHALILGLVFWPTYRAWRMRQPLGHCRSCGYDLRATPARCPECGNVPVPPDPSAACRPAQWGHRALLGLFATHLIWSWLDLVPGGLQPDVSTSGPYMTWPFVDVLLAFVFCLLGLGFRGRLTRGACVLLLPMYAWWQLGRLSDNLSILNHRAIYPTAGWLVVNAVAPVVTVATLTFVVACVAVFVWRAVVGRRRN